MDRKQLAEMIKMLRKKKLEEIIGKPGKFDPEHRTTHPEDPTSPNQYLHKMGEARIPVVRGGAQGKATLGRLETRVGQQRARGNQNQRGRFLGEKGEVELGATDTGKKGNESETVDVNPKDNTALAKGDINKNTTVKETKEK